MTVIVACANSQQSAALQQHLLQQCAGRRKSKGLFLWALQMFDLLGYDADVHKHWNKINIHVGGTYGDKGESLVMFRISYGSTWPIKS